MILRSIALHGSASVVILVLAALIAWFTSFVCLELGDSGIAHVLSVIKTIFFGLAIGLLSVVNLIQVLVALRLIVYPTGNLRLTPPCQPSA